MKPAKLGAYRRVYLARLVLFTLASLFCAFAHTLPLLTVARIVQGFGAAGIMRVNMALIRYIYPRDLLGLGIGINAIFGRGRRCGRKNVAEKRPPHSITTDGRKQEAGHYVTGRPRRPMPGNLSAGRRTSIPQTAPKKFNSTPSTHPTVKPR